MLRQLLLYSRQVCLSVCLICLFEIAGSLLRVALSQPLIGVSGVLTCKLGNSVDHNATNQFQIAAIGAGRDVKSDEMITTLVGQVGFNLSSQDQVSQFILARVRVVINRGLAISDGRQDRRLVRVVVASDRSRIGVVVVDNRRLIGVVVGDAVL